MEVADGGEKELDSSACLNQHSINAAECVIQAHQGLGKIVGGGGSLALNAKMLNLNLMHTLK